MSKILLQMKKRNLMCNMQIFAQHTAKGAVNGGKHSIVLFEDIFYLTVSIILTRLKQIR